MGTFETLKEEFIKRGFKVDGDTFIHETVTYNTMNINGRVIQQPQRNIFKLAYIGEGTIADAETHENSYPIWEFDVIGEGDEPVVTICINEFDDIDKLLG